MNKKSNIQIVKIFVFSFVLLVIMLNSITIKAQETQVDLLKNITKKELQRSITELKKEEKSPYFLSYYITETISSTLSSSFGKLIRSRDRVAGSASKRHTRTVDVELRVGSYKLDNTHIIRGSYDPFGGWVSSSSLPLENSEPALRVVLWQATDAAYKRAIDNYEKALSNQAVMIAAEDTSDDFSKERPMKYSEEFKKCYFTNTTTNNKIEKTDTSVFIIDTAKWNNVICRLSSKFAKHNWLLSGDVSFSAIVKNKLYINSEGTEVMFPETYARIMISARTKAEDGMSLPLYKSYFSYSTDGLPEESEISKDIDSLISMLSKLRTAPVATTFSGPAILGGEAAGVFFHEIFGHRVEGHREKDPAFAHTFKQSVGKKILPEFMSVIFNPTIKSIGKREISGYYKYDDEGQKAQMVETVSNGIFKNYLMSRSPIDGFSNSNGHGRREEGRSAVARQSNLIVSSTNSKSFENLRKQLIDEAKKQNKEYGLYFLDVTGGFTLLGRGHPNSFNVTPLVVYKIYTDGRPDELVRGVDLIGTPLTTFSNVIATGDDLGVFNGMCGAESGWVPVSAVSPSLLVSTVEVQKKSKSQTKLPILPAP